ncbi:MAG: hypothetical protein AAFY17_11530 [Cyanobacteria bacterium J06642_11]
MKLSITLVSIGSLALLGAYLFAERSFSFLTSANTMTNQSTATCDGASAGPGDHRSPIQTQLRVWLDPIPRSPDGHGTLPPGVEAPAPQPQLSETHALNLELSVVNASQEQQTVHVAGWNWRQGNRTFPGFWNIQPDMSPLNRSDQIQRHLVQLEESQTVNVTMDLEINGQFCRLQVQTRS